MDRKFLKNGFKKHYLKNDYTILCICGKNIKKNCLRSHIKTGIHIRKMEEKQLTDRIKEKEIKDNSNMSLLETLLNQMNIKDAITDLIVQGNNLEDVNVNCRLFGKPFEFKLDLLKLLLEKK